MLQQKPEFSDLEAIAHKIHTKADSDKVETLFVSLKKEVLEQMSKAKKEQKLGQKSKTEKSKELELNIAIAVEESKKCQDKILKLAAQFDKELVERDKQHKKSQTTVWDDI